MPLAQQNHIIEGALLCQDAASKQASSTWQGQAAADPTWNTQRTSTHIHDASAGGCSPLHVEGSHPRGRQCRTRPHARQRRSTKQQAGVGHWGTWGTRAQAAGASPAVPGELRVCTPASSLLHTSLNVMSPVPAESRRSNSAPPHLPAGTWGGGGTVELTRTTPACACKPQNDTTRARVAATRPSRKKLARLQPCPQSPASSARRQSRENRSKAGGRTCRAEHLRPGCRLPSSPGPATAASLPQEAGATCLSPSRRRRAGLEKHSAAGGRVLHRPALTCRCSGRRRTWRGSRGRPHQWTAPALRSRGKPPLPGVRA